MSKVKCYWVLGAVGIRRGTSSKSNTGVGIIYKRDIKQVLFTHLVMSSWLTARGVEGANANKEEWCDSGYVWEPLVAVRNIKNLWHHKKYNSGY